MRYYIVDITGGSSNAYAEGFNTLGAAQAAVNIQGGYIEGQRFIAMPMTARLIYPCTCGYEGDNPTWHGPSCPCYLPW